MISPRRRFAFVLASCFSLGGLGALAADWPQWRGPDRTGYVPADEPVPATLPREPKVVWRRKVGEGLASPVIAAGRVFYLDAVAGKETLHAIDAATASELWRASIDAAFADMQGPAGPRCTPVVEGGFVYAVSCRGELRCSRAADGELIWRANYTKDFSASFIGERGSAAGATRHGNNGSPLIAGDRLYACVGGTNGESVVCFDKRTGHVIWKSQNDQAGYAPPVLATLAGVQQLVCYTVPGLMGLDLRDGKLLWRTPVKTSLGRHVTTPVFAEDTVVVASHQAGLVGTRIAKAGSEFKAERGWQSKELAINFSSPVAVGKYLYGLGPARNLICVEVATGNRMWSQEGCTTTSADKAHAAFIVMGKSILALTDTGQLILFAADPSGFHEISRAQVCGLNWCNPAYADGRLYLREGIKTTGELLCVELISKS